MMNFGPKPDERQRKILGIAVIAAILIVVGAFALTFLGGINPSTSMKAVHLRCTSTQKVTPFGNSILYYDGTTLFCLNANGTEKWSFTLGSNAGFSCEGGTLAAWVDNQLFIFDANGRSTYNDHIAAGNVQFVRAGRRYVAAVVGDGTSPTLIVKDLDGLTVDEEYEAYGDMIILDAGFFGGGDYLWVTSLDVYGTVPATTMHTIRVGQMNTGEVSLGESLCYAVRYAGSRLNVVTTRQMLVYDYQCTQDKNATVLVYGWRLADWAEASGTAEMLFAPSRQMEDDAAVTELRLIRGTRDVRMTLPTGCVGAALHNSRIYAFSGDTVYRASYRDNHFTALPLPLSRQVTGYLGMLDNGTALLSCGNDVYAVSMP